MTQELAMEGLALQMESAEELQRARDWERRKPERPAPRLRLHPAIQP
jgi:hypothetical protein